MHDNRDWEFHHLSCKETSQNEVLIFWVWGRGGESAPLLRSEDTGIEV